MCRAFAGERKAEAGHRKVFAGGPEAEALGRGAFAGAREAETGGHRGAFTGGSNRPIPAQARRGTGLVAAAALLLAISGCGSSDEANSATVPAMSSSTAGTYYLAAVCPANQAFEDVDALTAGWDGQTETLSESDVSTLTDAADTLTTSARLLEEPPAPWPANVQVGVGEVAAEMGTVAGSYQAMATATSRDAAVGLAYTAGNTAGGEAQFVRDRLGLPPDGAANDGCP